MASKRSHDSAPDGSAMKRKCTSHVQSTLDKFFSSEGGNAGPSTSGSRQVLLEVDVPCGYDWKKCSISSMVHICG